MCKLQTPELCGVCVLRKRTAAGRAFPGLSYSSGLAALKMAALDLGFPRASEWGTHAFRRGWADEALKQGGLTSLFYSGGGEASPRSAMPPRRRKAPSRPPNGRWPFQILQPRGRAGQPPMLGDVGVS